MIRRDTLLRFGIAWTLGFAVLHVYWACGGRFGVPSDAPLIGSRPFFLAYDITAAYALGLAAGVVFLLGIAPTSALIRIARVGAATALVRGGAGATQDLVSVASGHRLAAGAAYDAWFVIAGTAFLLIVHATGTTASRSEIATSPVAPARTPRLPSTTT